MTELLSCPEFDAWWEENWGKQKHTANYTDANRAAFIAGMNARVTQHGERKLVEALEQIRDFRWSDERVNVLRHIARDALNSYQVGKSS